ncbi:MAG: cation diffusion facilitator family transporter [Peptoniphilaceae bacterium]|nr:cation diffusion facilitator family transporter [Peptoniphilaceae bacterium]MDY5766501.1 cation diffusion facilitator family transporter [Peptoniphilaceae bacterium]
MNEHTGRDKTIIRTSIIGILANLFLAVFKSIIGLAASSIAIMLDAVNNLTDAASAVITIVGTKLAGKEADKKHPFGYGRIEYLSAMVISLIVLYAGIAAFVESVNRIIHPDTPNYSAVALIIVAVAVVVKLVLGRYMKHVGEKVKSDSLRDCGEDSALDSAISASTLVAAGIYMIFHISMEAWLGAVIAILIIRSGFEMLEKTLSRILGERVDAKLAKSIQKTILGYPEISGVYDLVMHNYGPDSYNASVHIEVPDTLSAGDLDKLTRKITVDVFLKHDVILTAVGVYSINIKDPQAVAARNKVLHIAMENPSVLQMHGFYLDKEEKTLRFDVVVSLDAEDREQVYREVFERVQKEYPDYTLQVAMDTDFSEGSEE